MVLREQVYFGFVLLSEALTYVVASAVVESHLQKGRTRGWMIQRI